MKRAIIVFIIGLLLANMSFMAHGAMILITEEEAAKPDAPHGHYEIGRVLNNGPEIKVLTPKMNEENASPVQIHILFVTQNGGEVDLSTLKVEYLKFFTIDLTERVLPYASKEGVKIEDAKLPSGTHKLRVTIADTAGGITQEQFTIKVM